MEKNGPKLMRGAMMTGCGMWAPIIPPVSESKTSEGHQGVASDTRLIDTPIPISVPSGLMPKAKP